MSWSDLERQLDALTDQLEAVASSGNEGAAATLSDGSLDFLEAARSHDSEPGPLERDTINR